LATATVPAERVAQIRKALTLSARDQYPQPSPMTRALADIAQFELTGSGHDNYGIAGELGGAREKFFGYDESELGKRMAMPAPLHYMDHSWQTPLDWMPFEPNSRLPNLFHGSMSDGLPSIFTERTMFSAKELRLRGIEQ